MFERRQDSRISTSKRGLIKFGAAGAGIVCSVNDLTPRGAGLSVISSFGVPRLFQLAIDGEAGTRHCKVIWTDGKKLGVSFEQALDARLRARALNFRSPAPCRPASRAGAGG